MSPVFDRFLDTSRPSFPDAPPDIVAQMYSHAPECLVMARAITSSIPTKEA